MVRRRAKAAGITTEVRNHTFRGTGITAYLENGGTLEKARQMAAHASTAPPSSTTGARTA
jgi:integrase